MNSIRACIEQAEKILEPIVDKPFIHLSNQELRVMLICNGIERILGNFLQQNQTVTPDTLFDNDTQAFVNRMFASLL